MKAFDTWIRQYRHVWYTLFSSSLASMCFSCAHFLFVSATHLNKQMIQYVFIISNTVVVAVFGCAHKTYRHWKMNLKTKIVINVDFIFFFPHFSVLMAFYFSCSISLTSRPPTCERICCCYCYRFRMNSLPVECVSNGYVSMYILVKF